VQQKLLQALQDTRVVLVVVTDSSTVEIVNELEAEKAQGKDDMKTRPK